MIFLPPKVERPRNEIQEENGYINAPIEQEDSSDSEEIPVVEENQSEDEQAEQNCIEENHHEETDTVNAEQAEGENYNLRRREKLKMPTRFEDYHTSLLAAKEDPGTYEEATSGEDAESWKKAIGAELKALVEVCDQTKGQKYRYCRLQVVFRQKIKNKGNTIDFKARLVARGFKQSDAIYADNYSPVAKLTSIRIFLAFCNEHNLRIHQLDVCSAFLYGEIKEDDISLPDGCGDVVPGLN